MKAMPAVTHRPEPGFKGEATALRGPVLQRACACGRHTPGGGQCAACRDKKAELRRAAAGAAPPEVAPPIVHEVLRAPGRPLDPEARAFMEPRFGHDFSRVRIHQDSDAQRSARDANALAYTVGQDIVFGAGRYSPRTHDGRWLLAHELAHTIQQASGIGGGLQMQDDDGRGGDALESQADAAADRVMVGANDAVLASAGQAKSTAAKANPCTRTILAEGTCQDLATKSAWVCCDPDNGFSRPGKKTSKAQPGVTCPSEKWSPTFTCDNTCEKSLELGCSDGDNWMALPGSQFKRASCGDVYTICANGSQTTAYVRDKSVTASSFEVSPAVQNALGVTVGSSFKGAVYRPGAARATIDKDPCCKAPQASPQAPTGMDGGDAETALA